MLDAEPDQRDGEERAAEWQQKSHRNES
jgi:hypothetical protein